MMMRAINNPASIAISTLHCFLPILLDVLWFNGPSLRTPDLKLINLLQALNIPPALIMTQDIGHLGQTATSRKIK